MQYRHANYLAGDFDTYWFEKNLQGDVVAVYAENSTKLISYTYDAWGNFTTTYHNGCTSTFTANYNPFRYRGYYYDVEEGLYYLQSRYYDPAIGRFLNADIFISTGQGLLGCNMFAYCNNDPILYADDSGYACHVLGAKSPGFGIMDGIVDAGGGGGITSARSSLPIVSKPNSVEILHNPDGTAKQIRWYGPDGKAERDRDNNHGGDGPFPHDHEWKDGKRGKEHLDPSPDYESSTRPGLGIGIVIICIIGIGVSVVDDTTGVGVIDDCLIPLLCAGLQNGLSMIFG